MTIVKTPKIDLNDANFPIQHDPGPRLKYTEKFPISRQYVSLFSIFCRIMSCGWKNSGWGGGGVDGTLCGRDGVTLEWGATMLRTVHDQVVSEEILNS